MKKEKIYFKVLANISLIMVCLICTASYAEKNIISQAATLQRVGDYQQGYQLLQSHDEYVGVFEYDYLLGQLAIDSGHPLQAIFALERALDQKPDFAPARAELARAYFLIGENEAAKVAFKKAQASKMPKSSKKLIDRYISSIDERILGGISKSSFHIAAGLGHDSNVNSATATSQIAVPTGTLTLLVPETDSSIGLVQMGGQFSHAITTDKKFYGSAEIKTNEAFDEKEFSTQTADAVLGIHFLQGVNQYRLALVGQVFALDGTASRNLLGVNGQWQRAFSVANQLTLFGQYAGLRYPEASRLNVDQVSAGATWLHSFTNEYQPIAYITGYYGSEKEQTDIAGSEFIGRDYYGIRAGVYFKTSVTLLWSAVLTYQQSEYGGINPLFGIIREDDFFNLLVGADYGFNQGWKLQPEISYSKNDSELEINSYERLRAMLTVRKEF